MCMARLFSFAIGASCGVVFFSRAGLDWDSLVRFNGPSIEMWACQEPGGGPIFPGASTMSVVAKRHILLAQGRGAGSWVNVRRQEDTGMVRSFLAHKGREGKVKGGEKQTLLFRYFLARIYRRMYVYCM